MTASFFAEVPNFLFRRFPAVGLARPAYYRAEYMASPRKTFSLLREKAPGESLRWLRAGEHPGPITIFGDLNDAK
jgi:hypothetical protein